MDNKATTRGYVVTCLCKARYSFPMRSSIALCLSAAELLAAVAPVLTWHEKHVMPEGVSGGALASLSGKLIYAGGTAWRNQVKQWLTDTVVYDRQTDAWSKGPALPEPLAYGACIRTDRSLEILGGLSDSGLSRKCWRLDAGSERWVESGVVPSGTVFGRAEVVQGHAYLFGGCPSTELSLCATSVLKRDPSGGWEKVSEMPEGPIAMSAISMIRNQVYLFGGCSSLPPHGVRNRNEAFRFDPLTNQWKTLRPLPEATRGMTAVPVNQRYLLLAGGYMDAPAGFSATAYLYDTENDQYTRIAPLPFPVMGMEMTPQAGSIWALGGEDKPRHRSSYLLEAKLPE